MKYHAMSRDAHYFQTAMSSNTIEWEDPFVRLVADPHRSIMAVEWKGVPPSAHYRTMLGRVLVLIRDHKLRRLLTDQRHRGTILPPDQAWLVQEWTPAFALLGVDRIAVIENGDVLNRATLDKLVEQTTAMTKATVSFFSDAPQAEQWLNQA